MHLQDATFLISGGASGLGAETVRWLHRRGGRVAIADVNSADGQQLAAQLGEQARFFETDVRDAVAVQRTVAQTVDAFGALHGAVNCAGVAYAERILGRRGVHRLETFTRTIEVNLYGTFNVIRFAAEAMARNEPHPDSGERGVIVNTASIAAFDGQIGQAAYAASKGAIAAMTLPIARDLAARAIRVMTIAPGVFDTPLLANLPEAARQALAQQVPFPNRLGVPADFAALVLHIVENEMLNGAVIRLDGALRMPPG